MIGDHQQELQLLLKPYKFAVIHFNNGLVGAHSDWHSTDGVHFNEKGKAAQAKQVAESICETCCEGGRG